jgi:hypothetical protein
VKGPHRIVSHLAVANNTLAPVVDGVGADGKGVDQDEVGESRESSGRSFENCPGRAAVVGDGLARASAIKNQERDMTETKLALMTRLRADGRWEAADKFREETRVRLKDDGMRRRDAAEEAWRLTAEKYRPIEALSAESVAVPADTTDAAKVFLDLQNAPDFEFLLRWTLKYIGLDPDTIPASQIPSRSCRSMLGLANRDPKTFWTWLAKSDCEAKKKADAERTYADDKRKHFRLFELILADLHATENLEKQLPCCDESGRTIASASS